MNSDGVVKPKQTSEMAIVRAKQSVDDAITAYTAENSRQLSQRALADATSQLHTAVINLHWVMRVHSRETDYWDEFDWQGRHPKTDQPVVIDGLADLDEWADKYHYVKSGRSGPYRGMTTHQVHVDLPPAAALEAAKTLFDIFDESGWSADRKRKRGITHLGDDDV